MFVKKALFFYCNFTFARVKLLPIFTDNMVLQQRTNAAIWGFANAGSLVTVVTSWIIKDISQLPMRPVTRK